MATVGWDQGRVATLSIPSSGTESDVLDMGSQGTVAAYKLGIASPAGLLTGTITLEVCDTEAGAYVTLQSDGADINLTAAKAAVLAPVPFRYIKIASSAAEGAQRDFIVKGFLEAR